MQDIDKRLDEIIDDVRMFVVRDNIGNNHLPNEEHNDAKQAILNLIDEEVRKARIDELEEVKKRIIKLTTPDYDLDDRLNQLRTKTR